MPAQATLVIGANAEAREAAIAAALDPGQATAIILEGMPSGNAPLADLAANFSSLSIAWVAPGCICCSGNQIMRVTLNRLLRQQPERLFISLADATHLPQIRAFLMQEPYGKLLSLTKEIAVDSRSNQ